LTPKKPGQNHFGHTNYLFYAKPQLPCQKKSMTPTLKGAQGVMGKNRTGARFYCRPKPFFVNFGCFSLNNLQLLSETQ